MRGGRSKFYAIVQYFFQFIFYKKEYISYRWYDNSKDPHKPHFSLNSSNFFSLKVRLNLNRSLYVLRKCWNLSKTVLVKISWYQSINNANMWFFCLYFYRCLLQFYVDSPIEWWFLLIHVVSCFLPYADCFACLTEEKWDTLSNWLVVLRIGLQMVQHSDNARNRE